MDIFNKWFGSGSGRGSGRGSVNSMEMTPTERELVQQLVTMGFEDSPALFAVRRSQGNLEQAVMILTEDQESKRMSSTNSGSASRMAAEAAMRRHQHATSTVQKAKRTSGGTAVQKRANKKKPEQIQALAEQLAQYPKALDAVLFITKSICNSPQEQKFKSIRSNNKVFKEMIEGCPCAEQFLKSLGFVKRRVAQDAYEFFLSSTDVALLWIGKTSLEAEKEKDVYKYAKEVIAFEKALKESLSSASKEEESRRAVYLSQIPKEPDPSSSVSPITKIKVNLAGKHFQRIFYNDEMLTILIQWLGSLSSIVPDKLISGEWQLVDHSFYPPKAVPVASNLNRTLQALQWFPSAEILIQPVGKGLVAS